MGYEVEHVRYVEHTTGVTKPYLERDFLPAQYLGQDGEANENIIAGVLDRTKARTTRLADSEVVKPGPTAKFNPDKPVDPQDYASKPTNPDLKTVELPLISDVWNGSEPINYHCQIQVGNPPQSFYIDLDTGSSLFWLQSILDDKADSQVLLQSSYSPENSLDAVDQNAEDRAKYGDGDLVEVSLYTDTITVGKMVIPKALIGAAPTHGIKPEFQLSKANGILGLGFPTDPKNVGRRNLVQVMYDRGLVRHASFSLIGPRVDPKLASEIDKKVLMKPRGTFVIGSVDPAYYTGSIAWCPQIISTNRWIVKLDKILINGEVAFKNQIALIDTGTAYMVASPSNFEKTQTFIQGAKPLTSKGGNMFTFPSENLKKIGFVFGGREFRLFPQDFGLGGVKSESGRMCSSIVKLPEWEFDENLWVIGGIFLDNVVTTFDYEDRKVGFADINEKDLSLADPAAIPAPLNTPAIALIKAQAATSATDQVPAPAAQPVQGASPKSPKLIASDADFSETSVMANTTGGRETVQRITFGKKPECQIATGITSFDLGYQHVRLTTFATENHYDSFNLHMNASADQETHGVLPNPDSDTIFRYGKAAWLRTLPNDPNFQAGRYTLGNSYPKGKQLSVDNTATIKFPRSFSAPPKVVLWLSAMDFSKSVNWRLKADVKDVTADGFTMIFGPWKDTILYKADVSWIAHADVPSIQSGTFSTEEIRGEGWQLENKGFSKFAKPFAKPPRVVAALSKIEFGYYRDIRVKTTTKVSNEGIDWTMNSDGDVHQYVTRCSYIAFDADLETVSASIN